MRHAFCIECLGKLSYDEGTEAARCSTCRDARRAENVEIYRRYCGGESAKQLAQAFDRTLPAVRGVIIRQRAEYQGAIDSNEPGSGARCRCGLLLPCNSCLPPIEAYAAMRRYQ